jgi:hypothetical protein
MKHHKVVEKELHLAAIMWTVDNKNIEGTTPT